MIVRLTANKTEGKLPYEYMFFVGFNIHHSLWRSFPMCQFCLSYVHTNPPL